MRRCSTGGPASVPRAEAVGGGAAGLRHRPNCVSGGPSCDRRSNGRREEAHGCSRRVGGPGCLARCRGASVPTDFGYQLRPGLRSGYWARKAGAAVVCEKITRCLPCLCPQPSAPAFRWSTCCRRPSKMRRTCTIWRPASTLARRPRSRSRWRRVCSPTRRSAPASSWATR